MNLKSTFTEALKYNIMIISSIECFCCFIRKILLLKHSLYNMLQFSGPKICSLSYSRFLWLRPPLLMPFTRICQSEPETVALRCQTKLKESPAPPLMSEYSNLFSMDSVEVFQNSKAENFILFFLVSSFWSTLNLKIKNKNILRMMFAVPAHLDDENRK